MKYVMKHKPQGLRYTIATACSIGPVYYSYIKLINWKLTVNEDNFFSNAKLISLEHKSELVAIVR